MMPTALFPFSREGVYDMPEIYQFTVNGKLCSTGENKPLLRYLRDDLHLHSVKDGCSEGACGTCTIIVDGVAVKSCVLTTKKAAGRKILTVEGLTNFEKDAFVIENILRFIKAALKPQKYPERKDIL